MRSIPGVACVSFLYKDNLCRRHEHSGDRPHFEVGEIMRNLSPSESHGMGTTAE